jgi:hypothetical protein
MQTEDKITQRIIEDLEAMDGTIEQQREHRKKRLEPVLNKLDQAKSELFADHLNKRFMDAVMANNAVQMSLKWHTATETEKVAFTQNVVNMLVKLLHDDIMNNRVTLYNRDGTVYTPTNDEFDKIYKKEISDYINSFVKFTVEPYDNGLMGVNRNRKIHINFNFELYKGFEIFLMDLRHEMMHLVDIFIPQISTLDPEVSLTAQHYYLSGQDVFDSHYEPNPLELNANLRRKEFRILCMDTLAKAAAAEQARTQNLQH